MGNYLPVPVLGLFCYAFLFMTMVAAKKNKIVFAFSLVIISLIFWTGGSLFMRLRMWPSEKFWFDLSIMGLLCLGFSLFNFAYAFVGAKAPISRIVWAVITVVMNVINIATGVFIAAPTVTESAGSSPVFVYDTKWPVAFLFVFCGLIIFHMFFLLFSGFRKKSGVKSGFTSIFVGIGTMFLGHILFLFPFFSGIPTDILSGIIFAFCLFYALYRRHLVKLTLLVSRQSCYIISAGLALVIFANLVRPIAGYVHAYIPLLAEFDILIAAFSFTLTTFVIYALMKRFIDAVFAKEERLQAEALQEFGRAVSKSLKINDILSHLVRVIQDSLNVQKVYVCLADHNTSDIHIVHSTSPLDSKSFVINRDSPLVSILADGGECLLMRDFKRSVSYKSMWEQEKKQLNDLLIECFVPLRDESGLVGLVMLTAKQKGNGYSPDDLHFLSSVDSIGSIAIKNSRLYEKAHLEARTDELTGLLNRKYFYEVLQSEYAKDEERSLSLVIINIDDFKLYNELYGTREGDTALQNVARILSTCVGENGHVARYSGKEFAVILPGFDQLSAKNLASIMLRQINEMDRREGDYTLKTLTASVGLCSIPSMAKDVFQLVRYADMAVYHVKRNGKNAVLAYSSSDSITRQTTQEIDKKESAYSEYANTIYALTAAIDTKDHYTFNHSNNVAYYSAELAYAINMSPENVEIIKEAALLHDIGKIGIPEHILNKPGQLTNEEYEVMKGHVENSIGIIRHLPSLDYVIPAVIGHHERYDGRGYPRRIAGEDIPLMARILCIADSFDAMISRRSYKQSYSIEFTLNVVAEESGKQFDPKLAEVFIRLVRSGKIKTNANEDGIVVSL